MKIKGIGRSGYHIRCACGRHFSGNRLSVGFECPSCGTARDPAWLISEWLLDRPAPHRAGAPV